MKDIAVELHKETSIYRVVLLLSARRGGWEVRQIR
jgi:hypothetical protein